MELALSVATTPEGMICDSCAESSGGSVLPQRRIRVKAQDFPACAYCGDPITPDFGPLLAEDLSY